MPRQAGTRAARRMGCLFLSAIFVRNGAEMLLHAGDLRVAMVQRAGMPCPHILVRLNGAVMLAGGSMAASGRLPKAAASLLIPALVATTLVGHPFWRETDQTKRRDHEIHCMKNLGLIGGVLLLVADDADDSSQST